MLANQIINNTKLLNLLDKYLSSDEIKDNLPSVIIKKLADNLNNPEYIIPVLGSQGLGKSTLINAILGANILPNDADETTCVPVEIRYGTKDSASVYFQSGQITEIALSCDTLREFVDNNENKGNEKHVSHIVLKTPCTLLKNGLVIVDLPGVGSLTKNNQETTMKYIQQLCTAIFVIPTVPTIRRSEEIFIRGAWSSFSSAIFVQNRWQGETDTEVNESVAFNSLVLKNIAQKANTTFNGKICVVNAYQAIVSKLNNNTEEFKKSNLQELLTELNSFQSNRVQTEEINFKAKIRSYIDAVQTIIRHLIDESQMNEEQLLAQRTRIQEEFDTATKEIQILVDDLIECTISEKERANDFAKKVAKTASENLHADIWKLIDNGIVDGAQLTEAFSDCQEKYLLDAIEENYDFMNELTYNLGKKLDILAEKINVERASSFESQKFESKQAFKFEKGLDIGIRITGGFGSFFAGSAISGAIAGLPAIVVATIVGLGIYIIGSLIGKQTKHEITVRRGLQAKRAIEPLIEEFKDRIYKTISTNSETVLNNVTEILRSYMNDRYDYYEKMKDAKNQAADNDHKSKYDITELNTHLSYLENEKEGLK